jgi:hypothetical protein
MLGYLSFIASSVVLVRMVSLVLMHKTTNELYFIRALVTNEDLMGYILEGVGSEFNPIVVAANARSEPFSFIDMVSFILFHESLLQTQVSTLSLSTRPNSIRFYSHSLIKLDSTKLETHLLSYYL